MLRWYLCIYMRYTSVGRTEMRDRRDSCMHTQTTFSAETVESALPLPSPLVSPPTPPFQPRSMSSLILPPGDHLLPKKKPFRGPGFPPGGVASACQKSSPPRGKKQINATGNLYVLGLRWGARKSWGLDSVVRALLHRRLQGRTETVVYSLFFRVVSL